MSRPLRTTVLALAVAATLAAGAAAAQDRDTRTLEQAQADLRRAAQRVAELTRERIGDGAAQRPVLGVVLAADPGAGVRIAAVTPDSAAEDVGLRAGDRLTEIGGTPILGSDGQTRLANARRLLAGIEAGKPVRLGYERDGRTVRLSATPKVGTQMALLSGERLAATLDGARAAVNGDGIRRALERVRIDTAGLGQEIERALSAAGLDPDCAGPDCDPPALLSAVRWSGLNLAAIDADLGRYFGTDRGVLVLSTGSLEGLRAGDVIQRIDGRPVATPREAMRQLRGRDEGERVEIAYLRDRKPATARVAVPALRSLRIPAPPAPPAPPRVEAPPAPPAPPEPPYGV